MQLKTLEQTSIGQIAATFNAAFADYEIPLQFTEEDLLQKIKVEDIDLRLSVGAFIDDSLVGFIFFGLDNNVNGLKTAWDGGTGVIPSSRGQKLTQQMFEFMLPKLKLHNTQKLLLEVLENNHGARRIYEALGFTKTRKLNAYKGVLKAGQQTNHKIEVLKDFNGAHLLSLGDFQPPWQQMTKRVDNWGSTVTTIGIRDKGNVIAYARYNDVTKRVLQFAVRKEHRNQGMATALFQHISGDNKTPVTIINVDDNSPSTNSFLRSIGLQGFISQYEMEMDLSSAAF